MSTLSVTKTVKVGGVLTAATSFTATVVRTDTGASVTATATNPSTGKYVWTWTEPTTGLTYTVSYIAVVSGGTQTWSETVVGSDAEAQVAMPELTGDTLADTLSSLQVERLRASRSGPLVTYRVGNQAFSWGEYLRFLDERINAVRAEIASTSAVEEIGVCF